MSSTGFYASKDGVEFKNSTLKTIDPSSPNHPESIGSPNQPRVSRPAGYQSPILGDAGAGEIDSGNTSMDTTVLHKVIDQIHTIYKTHKMTFKNMEGDDALAYLNQVLDSWVKEFVDPAMVGYDTVLNLVKNISIQLVDKGNSYVPSYPKPLTPIPKPTKVDRFTTYKQHFDGNPVENLDLDLSGEAVAGYFDAFSSFNTPQWDYDDNRAGVDVNKMLMGSTSRVGLEWKFATKGRVEFDITADVSPKNPVLLKINNSIVGAYHSISGFRKKVINIPKQGTFSIVWEVTKHSENNQGTGIAGIRNLKLFELTDDDPKILPVKIESLDGIEDCKGWVMIQNQSLIKASFHPEVAYGINYTGAGAPVTVPKDENGDYVIDPRTIAPPVDLGINSLTYELKKSSKSAGHMVFKYRNVSPDIPSQRIRYVHKVRFGTSTITDVVGESGYKFEVTSNLSKWTNLPTYMRTFDDTGTNECYFKVAPKDFDAEWLFQFRFRYDIIAPPGKTFGFTGMSEYISIGDSRLKLSIDPANDVRAYRVIKFNGKDYAMGLWKILDGKEIPPDIYKPNPSFVTGNSLVFADVGDVSYSEAVISFTDNYGNATIPGAWSEVNNTGYPVMDFSWLISGISGNPDSTEVNAFKSSFKIVFYSKAGSVLKTVTGAEVFSSNPCSVTIPWGAWKAVISARPVINGKDIYNRNNEAYDKNDYFSWIPAQPIFMEQGTWWEHSRDIKFDWYYGDAYPVHTYPDNNYSPKIFSIDFLSNRHDANAAEPLPYAEGTDDVKQFTLDEGQVYQETLMVDNDTTIYMVHPITFRGAGDEPDSVANYVYGSSGHINGTLVSKSSGISKVEFNDWGEYSEYYSVYGKGTVVCEGTVTSSDIANNPEWYNQHWAFYGSILNPKGNTYTLTLSLVNGVIKTPNGVSPQMSFTTSDYEKSLSDMCTIEWIPDSSGNYTKDYRFRYTAVIN